MPTVKRTSIFNSFIQCDRGVTSSEEFDKNKYIYHNILQNLREGVTMLETPCKSAHIPALDEMLNHIKQKAQPLFPNPLCVGHSNVHTEFHGPFYYVAEEQRAMFLGFIPYIKRKRTLLAIGHHATAVNGTLFDPSLLEIVREELKILASTLGAVKIHLTHKFE